jgi:hypothetical protein
MPVFRRFGLAAVFFPAGLRLAAFRVADLVAAFRVALFRFEARFADFLLVAIVSPGLMWVPK